jgi:hypothetical protein
MGKLKYGWGNVLCRSNGELAIELAERTTFVVDPTNLNQVILAEGTESENTN